MDYYAMGLGLTAGLMLFLLGVGMMSDGLKAVAGDRMKSVLARFTSNRLAGVATGAAVTTVLDSSSATTIMVVGLVDAGLLELSQALGVILGANIGTTVSSQLIASDVMQYAPIALLVGFLMRSLTKGETWPQVGTIVLGLGLVFFGLDHMEEATRPLQDHEPFLALMHRMENPLLGVAAGAIFTAIIASSSAMLGIIIVMAGNGAITLPAALALMMGAEIGTCADTLLATAGRSRAAVRAGVFQLIFNVVQRPALDRLHPADGLDRVLDRPGRRHQATDRQRARPVQRLQRAGLPPLPPDRLRPGRAAHPGRERLRPRPSGRTGVTPGWAEDPSGSSPNFARRLLDDMSPLGDEGAGRRFDRPPPTILHEPLERSAPTGDVRRD